MSAATQNTLRPQETTRLIHLDLWPLAHSSIQLSSLCPSAGAISKVRLQGLSQVSQLSSGISALPPGSTESCVCPQASLNARRGCRALSKGSGGADSLVEGWSKGSLAVLFPGRWDIFLWRCTRHGGSMRGESARDSVTAPPFQPAPFNRES